MNVPRINDTAAQVQRLYKLFEGSLISRYLTARMGGMQLLGVLHDLRDDGYDFAHTFLDAVDQTLDGFVQQAALDGLPGVSTAFEDRRQQLKRFYYQMLVGNVEQARGWLSSPVDVSRMFNRHAGTLGLLLQNQLARPHFTTPDSVGRIWPSATMVLFTTRDALYQAEIDATVQSLISEGHLNAQIVYPSAHEFNGFTVRLEDADMESRAPLLVDVRDRFFHPNATASLEAPHVFA